MVTVSKELLLKEAVEVLFKQLGPEKAIKFLQLSGICRGNSVKEIESQTEVMTEEEAVNFILKHGRRSLK